MKLITTILTLGCANAFINNNFAPKKLNKLYAVEHDLDNKEITYGRTKFFNGDVYIRNMPIDKFKYQREAEIQHGRVAMLSLSLLQLIDKCYPDTLAINFLNNMPINAQYGVMAFFGLGEFYRLLVNYDLGLWELKKDAIPGDYRGDKFNISKDKLLYFKNIELNNGRLAMCAIIPYMFLELVSGSKMPLPF